MSDYNTNVGGASSRTAYTDGTDATGQTGATTGATKTDDVAATGADQSLTIDHGAGTAGADGATDGVFSEAQGLDGAPPKMTLDEALQVLEGLVVKLEDEEAKLKGIDAKQAKKFRDADLTVQRKHRAEVAKQMKKLKKLKKLMKWLAIGGAILAAALTVVTVGAASSALVVAGALIGGAAGVTSGVLQATGAMDHMSKGAAAALQYSLLAVGLLGALAQAGPKLAEKICEMAAKTAARFAEEAAEEGTQVAVEQGTQMAENAAQAIEDSTTVAGEGAADTSRLAEAAEDLDAAPEATQAADTEAAEGAEETAAADEAVDAAEGAEETTTTRMTPEEKAEALSEIEAMLKKLRKLILMLQAVEAGTEGVDHALTADTDVKLGRANKGLNDDDKQLKLDKQFGDDAQRMLIDGLKAQGQTFADFSDIFEQIYEGRKRSIHEMHIGAGAV